MHNRNISLLLLLFLMTWLSGRYEVFARGHADVIFSGGKIYTIDTNEPRAEAVAVSGDRVVYVGSEDGVRAYSGPATRWVDLEGKILIPGLVDAHAHIKGLGRYLANLQLTGTVSVSEIKAMVLSTQKNTPSGRWIRGRGWDQNDWEKKEYPSWKDLEGTEANPVYLRRVDGHASWVNRTALALAGITRDTPDPPGGKIIRDKEGEPTGILIDEAADLVSEIIPRPGPVELDEWILSAVKECNRVGLTGMHDAGTTREDLASFERLHQKGLLTLRLYCMLDADEEEFVRENFIKGPRQLAGGMVVVRSVKMYADGALGSRGAALLEPYTDDPGNEGLIVDSPEKIESLSREALEHGFQINTHAIGDRGVRMTLDAYENALKAHTVRDHRFRIEHSQVVALSDIPRYRELGVIPSMQPTHATSDMYWAEDRVGRERIKGAYAWRRFLDEGNRLPLGSDFPVESPDPLWGIYAAVTRQDHKGWPEGGWYPGQKLSVFEAVRGFTLDAAYAGFAEERSGTIEVGKLADFTVLDRDIFVLPPEKILETTVVFTVVGGKIVFDSNVSN